MSRKHGGVSNVDIDGSHTMQIKSIGVAISTFETLPDSSGNGNTGTGQNGVASTSGKFANATNYDGVNDDVDAGTVTSIR